MKFQERSLLFTERGSVALADLDETPFWVVLAAVVPENLPEGIREALDASRLGLGVTQLDDARLGRVILGVV